MSTVIFKSQAPKWGAETSSRLTMLVKSSSSAASHSWVAGTIKAGRTGELRQTFGAPGVKQRPNNWRFLCALRIAKTQSCKCTSSSPNPFDSVPKITKEELYKTAMDSGSPQTGPFPHKPTNHYEQRTNTGQCRPSRRQGHRNNVRHV